MSGARWLGEHAIEGDLAFRIGRDGDALVAEWIDLCELRCDRRGERVSFVAREGADARTVAKVKAGLAAALVRHLQAGTSLHASAVARGGRALAFLGRSGAGKSTTAAWLCRERGFALLADDVVEVELGAASGALARPTESEHWLGVASCRALGLPEPLEADKEPRAASRVERAPARLEVALSLALGEPDDAPRITRVRGHRAVELLVPCLVRFVLDEPEAQIAELGRIDTLVSRVPLCELRLPRDLRRLPEVGDLVEALLVPGASEAKNETERTER
ncbi:MAG: hypothetical protein KF819_23510 [Labilithrix sp.]|nr:hypothetical protein [Labilithrix sp.]